VRIASVLTLVRVKFNAGRSCEATVDGRTARQWINSAIEYCNWRAGDSWRRLSDPAQRHDPERWVYIEAARTLHTALYSTFPARPVPVLDCLTPTRPSHAQLKYRNWKRPELVEALLLENPKLTDRRILSHYTRAKLARMLDETRREAAIRARVTK